jgi:MSHA pilin protein MshD
MCTSPFRQAGTTLVELIIFVVIVSVALAGVLTVLNMVVMHSADPLVRKQAVAIAESLMEEATLQPFTYCDPGDANVSWATSATVGAGAGDCTAVAEAAGPEGEGRFADPRFDNVNDYNGFAMVGISDVTGAAIPNLGAYNATVTVANAGAAFNAANGTAYADEEVLRVDVAVTVGAETVTLTSHRFRYAPNVP